MNVSLCINISIIKKICEKYSKTKLICEYNNGLLVNMLIWWYYKSCPNGQPISRKTAS